MTMHRRPVGRTRLLAAIGALRRARRLLPAVVDASAAADGLPDLSGTAFEGMGILVFAAAIATLALVTLPYASERPVAADRWTSYALIAGRGLARLRLPDRRAGSLNAFSFTEPADIITHIPGLWLAGIGLAILARADVRDAPGAAAPLRIKAPGIGPAGRVDQPERRRPTSVSVAVRPVQREDVPARPARVAVGPSAPDARSPPVALPETEAGNRGRGRRGPREGRRSAGRPRSPSTRKTVSLMTRLRDFA